MTLLSLLARNRQLPTTPMLLVASKVEAVEVTNSRPVAPRRPLRPLVKAMVLARGKGRVDLDTALSLVLMVCDEMDGNDSCSRHAALFMSMLMLA